MKKRVFSVLLMLFLVLQLSTAGERDKIDLQLEFDQMLQLRFGVTYNITDDLGVRASFGTAPLGFSTFSWNLMGVYHFSDPGDKWHIDLEFGLPLGYFNFIEDNWVDWDPYIDDPFEGWLAGASVRIGRRFSTGLWGARLGAASWWEHQRDSGWKGPKVMPIASLVYEF